MISFEGFGGTKLDFQIAYSWLPPKIPSKYIYNVPNMEVEGCGCNALLNVSMGISPFMSFIIAWIRSNEQGLSILSIHTTLWEINVHVHVSL